MEPRRLPLPTIKELEAFRAVVETGGINAAARRLSLARSVVSKRISDLEAVVGATLVQRTSGQSTLTEAGEGFHERAIALLLDLEDAVNGAREAGSGLTGTLRLTVPVDASATYLNEPLLDFAALHPNLQMVVDLEDRVRDLAAHGYDMAIRIGRLEDSSLRARLLCDSPRVLCAAPGYLQARGAPSSLDDLHNHDLIGYGNSEISCFWAFDSGKTAPHRLRVIPRLTFNNGGAMCAAAARGLGITLLPRFIVADSIAAGRLQIVELEAPPLSDAVYAVFHGGRPPSGKVRAMIDFLIERF